MILVIVGLSAAVVGAYGPMLSPGFVEVSAALGISVEILSQATAWLILCLGLILFLTNPAAKIMGRRPVYVMAISVMFATSVWSAVVKDYSSFLASRIVAGIGMAPYEVLVQCTIGDMYFVHERATRIAVWNLFLLTGIAGGALIAGQIIERDGYQWAFGVCAIFFGILMLAVLFLVPETAYRRDSVIVMVDPDSDEKPGVGHMKLGHEHDLEHHDGRDVEHNGRQGAATGATETKHTYLQSLRIFTGRYTDAPAWKILVRPVILLFYPGVMWAFLMYGTTLTWIVVFRYVTFPKHPRRDPFLPSKQPCLTSRQRRQWRHLRRAAVQLLRQRDRPHQPLALHPHHHRRDHLGPRKRLDLRHLDQEEQGRLRARVPAPADDRGSHPRHCGLLRLWRHGALRDALVGPRHLLRTG